MLGSLALLFWACSALLASIVVPIPTFEVLSVAFFISFMGTVIYLTIRKGWHKIKQPILLWVIGMIGVYGNDALYITAYKFSPPAEVELINYLWPVFVILMASFLPKERFSLKYLLAAIVGISGLALIVLHKEGTLAHFPHKWIGYLLAFCDAIVWAIYSVTARAYRETPSTMVGMYCGCGFVLSIISHFIFEPTVVPTTTELAVMIIFGITSQGSAYYLWDYGIKKGNMLFLSVLAYLTPVVGIILLILAGKSHYSTFLLEATLLIVGSSIICHLDMKRIYASSKRRFVRLTGNLFNKKS